MFPRITIRFVTTLLCFLAVMTGCSDRERTSEARLLALLPADTSGVFVAPVSRWSSVTKTADPKGPFDSLLTGLEGHCALGVLPSLRTVALARRASSAALLLVEGSLERAVIEDCLKQVAADHGDTVRVERDGKLVVYRAQKESGTLYGRWFDGVVALSNERAALADLVEESSPSSPSTPLRSALRGHAQAGALAYGFGDAALLSATALAGVEGLGAARSVSLQVLPQEGFHARAVLGLADAQTAQASLGALTRHRERLTAVPMLGAYAKPLNARAEGSELHVELSWTPEQRDSLVRLVSGLMSMQSKLAVAPTP